MSQTHHILSLKREPDGYRVETQYPLVNHGHVSISILAPLTNPTAWEAEAYACEQAAEGLLRYAKAYRDEIAKLSGQ